MAMLDVRLAEPAGRNPVTTEELSPYVASKVSNTVEQCKLESISSYVEPFIPTALIS